MKKFVHEYKGFGIHPSKCKVYIKHEGVLTFVGFEDMGEGTSVTNASEQLATEIVEKEGLNHEKTLFFEWYPYAEGTVSEVSYTWGLDKQTDKLKAVKPQWKFFCLKEDNPFN